jgi:hypothetical protein
MTERILISFMEPESEIQQLILRQIEQETKAITTASGKHARGLSRGIMGKVKGRKGTRPKLSIYLATVLSTLTALPRPFNH